MERCDINLLIDKTQKLLYTGVIDNGGPMSAATKIEVQKLKGDDGKIYKLSVLVEPYDPSKEPK